MDRRAYLATGLAVGLGGCVGMQPFGDDSDVEHDPPVAEDADEEDDPDPVRPDEIDTFDDFSDLDEWELVAGAVTRDDDEDRTYAGDQSARLEVRADDDQARLRRTFEEPLDCTGLSPGLAVAAESMTAPMIQLFDEDGDAITFRGHVDGDVELMRCPFGIQGTEGDPDLGAITEIQLAFVAGEETEADCWIDDLHFVPRPEQGIVMFQFDGGYASVYDEAAPVLVEYDYPATVFVAAERVREEEDHEGDRLTEDQLEEMADVGWTIGSHTAHSRILTDLDEDEAEEQIEDAREWLEDEGYEDGARYFSYPAGRYDQHGLELVAENHDLAFAGRQPAQGAVTNPLLCSRVVDPDAERVQEVLDLTAEYGGITPLCYYQFDDDDSIDRFEETLEYVNDLESDGDLAVIAVDEFADEYVV